MQKVIFFDLDGTLTPDNTWFLLNQRLGITPQEDHQLFLDYLENKFDYKGWMTAIMDIYKKGPLINKGDLNLFTESINLRPEAQDVINMAKEKGYGVVIISGSVDFIIKAIAEKLGVEAWFAKTSAVFNDIDQLVDMNTHGDGERDGKLNILQHYCSEKGLDIKSVICVEDGGNGLELFKNAKGILLGNNKELAPFAWKQVETLSEIKDII